MMQLIFRENLVLLGQFVSQGQDDLPLGLHATVLSLFNPIHGQRGNPGFAGKLSPAHEALLSDSLYEVVTQISFPVFVCRMYLDKIIYNYAYIILFVNYFFIN